MEKWVSVVEAERDLPKLLREMREDQEAITKHGNPYRAITPYEEY